MPKSCCTATLFGNSDFVVTTHKSTSFDRNLSILLCQKFDDEMYETTQLFYGFNLWVKGLIPYYTQEATYDGRKL